MVGSWSSVTSRLMTQICGFNDASNMVQVMVKVPTSKRRTKSSSCEIPPTGSGAVTETGSSAFI